MENIIRFIIIIINTIIIIYCGYIYYKERVSRKKELEAFDNWCDFWKKYHESNFKKE